MDQARVVFQAIWQQKFWVLCVTGVLIVSVAWSLTTADLDAQFAQRKSDIQRQFSAMQSLNSQALHPNQNVIAGNQNQLQQQSQITLEIWQDLYNSQIQEVLYWPQDHLRPQFIEEINKLGFCDPFPPAKSQDMRDNYWNYIENRFDGLLEIVNAMPLGAGRDRFAGGRGTRRDENLAASAEQMDGYLVQWLDQGELQKKLHFPRKPTELEIWVTQEDLWVYEDLLHVIAKTNQARGATRSDNTAVRVIVSLEVGRAAVAGGNNQGNILPPADSGESRNSSGDAGRGFGRGESSGGNDQDDSTAVLESRYLDLVTGEPLPAGNTANFGTEFRQLPIRMVLKMEQTWIPRLLVECADAALPIEVKKLRVNPQLSGAGFSATNRGTTPGLESPADTSLLVKVEIQGVVFIYNRPDKKKLNMPDAELSQGGGAAGLGELPLVHYWFAPDYKKESSRCNPI